MTEAYRVCHTDKPIHTHIEREKKNRKWKRNDPHALLLLSGAFMDFQRNWFNDQLASMRDVKSNSTKSMP